MFASFFFYNFRFMNSNYGCTQSSTQHLPQLTIINVVFSLILFFILQSVRNENTVFIAIIIIIMPRPINLFLAGYVEEMGQHTSCHRDYM